MKAIASRLRRMSAAELSWRVRAQVRIHAEHAAAVIRAPQWERADVRSALDLETLPAALQASARLGDWDDVHRQLWQVLRDRPSRFVLSPRQLPVVSEAIRSRWPEAVQDAVSRAEAVRAGRFDLLGYRALTFAREPGAGVDWHLDPVHGRRMPLAFWARVPYLDPACGDHKVVWELNRKQHWLALSRALWLTGDATYAHQMQQEFSSWLDDNPPLIGANWSSMLELAFRSLSWVWGLHACLAVDDAHPGSSWLVDLMVAIDRHLTHVERNLSLYFSPNTHLTGEALALYVVGAALPELASSTRWLDTGRAILVRELDRQVEPDGGHAERSTHYHRYTLDFYLLALLTARRIGDVEAEAKFADAVERLVTFARAMADGNGRLPRIGDDDGGRLWPITRRDPADIRDSLAVAAALLDRTDWAPWGAAEEAVWLTQNDAAAHQRALAMRVRDRRIRERRTLPFRASERRRGERRPAGQVLPFDRRDRRRGATERRASGTDRRTAAGAAEGAAADRRTTSVFPQTGYVTTATAGGDHLVIDAGPLGYMNAGHAHADALAVTLTLGGKPVLVDPGTPTYTMDLELRDRLRSSASHNTLTIDGLSSAVPRGPFHWQRRTDARLELVRHNDRLAYIQARHDGFGGVGHRRCVLATDAGYVFVDQVTGDGTHEAAQHWHFDPQWSVICESNHALRLMHECGDEAWLLQDRGAMWLAYGEESPVPSWVSPAYGVRVPAWTARVAHAAPAPFALVSWCGRAPAGAVPEIAATRCDGDADAAVAVQVAYGDVVCTTMIRLGDADTVSGPLAVGGLMETDARALQYTISGNEVTSVCAVDGTFVRTTDGQWALTGDRRFEDVYVRRDGDRYDVTTSTLGVRVTAGRRGDVHVRHRRVR